MLKLKEIFPKVPLLRDYKDIIEYIPGTVRDRKTQHVITDEIGTVPRDNKA